MTCPTCGEDGACWLCWGEDGYATGPIDPDDNPNSDTRYYDREDCK